MIICDFFFIYLELVCFRESTLAIEQVGNNLNHTIRNIIFDCVISVV